VNGIYILVGHYGAFNAAPVLSIVYMQSSEKKTLRDFIF